MRVLVYLQAAWPVEALAALRARVTALLDIGGSTGSASVVAVFTIIVFAERRRGTNDSHTAHTGANAVWVRRERILERRGIVHIHTAALRTTPGDGGGLRDEGWLMRERIDLWLALRPLLLLLLLYCLHLLCGLHGGRVRLLVLLLVVLVGWMLLGCALSRVTRVVLLLIKGFKVCIVRRIIRKLHPTKKNERRERWTNSLPERGRGTCTLRWESDDPSTQILSLARAQRLSPFFLCLLSQSSPTSNNLYEFTKG